MKILRKFYRGLGLVHKDELLTLHRLQMASTAQSYDLWQEGGRARSNFALNELFFGLSRLLQPQLFIEAGAKDAQTSIRMRRYLPDTEIVAFEASPVNYARFSENTALRENTIDYRHSAVSDYDGEIEFHIRKTADGKPVPKFSGANSILQRVAENVEYDVVKSKCIRLDTAFPTPKRNAIWVDVEGATKNVLRGASSFLANTSVALIEVEDYEIWKGQWTAAKVMSFLFELDLLPVARDFEYRGQYNILFVNRKHLTSNRDVWLNIERFHSVLSKPSLDVA